jgi:molybdopterin-guanine dinucleotide biosynthesis protein A
MPSAAILAGGRASRFGGLDKGALTVHGRSILDRQIDALSPLSDDIMYVGARPPAGYRGVLREVPDRLAGRGPLAGLEAALAAARHLSTLVIACDMPFVSTALLGHLAAAADDVAVPRTARGRHPLCACYTDRCQPAIARQLARGELPLHALLAQLRVVDIAGAELEQFGDPERLLTNINTSADYERIVDHQR